MQESWESTGGLSSLFPFAMLCELVLIIKRQYRNSVSQGVEGLRSAMNG